MNSFSEHSGHRQRMRKKFIENGLDIFEMHEVLELLLFYAVPMKNTSILAHRLLNEFGSLSAVFDSPIDVLMDFGLTETQAVFLKLMPGISRLYLEDKHNNTKKIINPDSVGEYIIGKFIGREEENVLALLLDAKGKEVYCGIISKGSINSTNVPIRKIVDLAMRYNAKSVILAHNHPSGVALPSKEDIDTTINVKNALELIGVMLVDHYIVADNDCVSLALSGIGESIFEVYDGL